MTIGNVSILTGLIICLIVLLLGEKLGLGTILNMILIGLFIDQILALNLIPQGNGFIYGAAMMLIGLFTIALASYFYISSGFSAGPRDSLMIAIERKTSLAVGICRGLLEGSAVFGISFCIQLVFSLLKFDATTISHETLGLTFKHFKASYRSEP